MGPGVLVSPEEMLAEPSLPGTALLSSGVFFSKTMDGRLGRSGFPPFVHLGISVAVSGFISGAGGRGCALWRLVVGSTTPVSGALVGWSMGMPAGGAGARAFDFEAGMRPTHAM